MPTPRPYQVTPAGEVINTETGRFLTPYTGDRGGHLRVQLGDRQYYVHRLVAEQYLGDCPPGQEVRHLDGDPTNNAVSNLAYGTRSQNVLDAVAHGTYRNANAEKSHCPRGHPYDTTNTYLDPSGRRRCRACRRTRK